MQDGATWVILIASQPADESASPTAAQGSTHEIQQLLARARSIASRDKICAIIAAEFAPHWRELAASVLLENRAARRRGESTQAAIGRALAALGSRDPRANLVLIPADHCAAEENAWVASAKNAVRLGAARANTVFVLHDKPQNDPRTSTNYPGVCSSSVMIGSIHAVRELCAGLPAISVVNLDIDDAVAPPLSSAVKPLAPLQVMHITSVGEYAKLQRGEYGRPRSRIDLHA